MNTIRNRNLQIMVFLLLCSFFAAHLCFWLLPDVFEKWNAQTIDQLFQFRSSSEKFRLFYNDTIVHVDLNNSGIQQLDNFSVNRSHFAKVIENLSAMDVAVQMYDFIFATRTNDKDDNKLKQATRKAGNVYLGLAFKLQEGALPENEVSTTKKCREYLEQTQWEIVADGDPSDLFAGIDPWITLPSIAEASKGLGHLSVLIDRDGVFRRMPLLVRYREAFYPSFSLRVICDYLGVLPENIIIKPGNTLTLKNAKRPGKSVPEDIIIPIDQYGNMVVNFVGPWDRMKHYSFVDILHASDDRDEMEMWREELSGKIVVVSDVSTAATDIGPTPTDTQMPLCGFHANAVHTILTKSFLRNFTFHEMLLIELALLIIVLFLSHRFASVNFTISIFLAGTLYLGIACACFLYGNAILNLIRPLLILCFCLISIVVYRYIQEEKAKFEGLRQRDHIRTTFGRYLSKEVVDEIIETPDGMTLGGELREVTFLVSDLRGFTSLSSRLSPHEVIDILNRFLVPMVEIIGHYNGTVDEFQGDGILVFFGAPLSSHDDPERAIQCAIEMQNKMLELNKEQTRDNLPELAMGIGINTGEVVVGSIGSETRSKYGAVGAAINMTYRIESYTTGGQILISRDTYEKVQSLVKVRGDMEVQFKGINQPVTLYDVSGMDGETPIFLNRDKAESLTPLNTPLQIKCFLVKGKTVSKKAIQGDVIHLGISSADVMMERHVPQYANIKLFFSSDDGDLSEAYAKVMSIETSDTTDSKFEAHLEFTSLPEDVKAFFEKQRVDKE